MTDKSTERWSDSKTIANAIDMAINFIITVRQDFENGSAKVTGRVQALGYDALNQLHHAKSAISRADHPAELKDASTELNQLAGKLSTENFSHRHPEDALNWLLENAEALVVALSNAGKPKQIPGLAEAIGTWERLLNNSTIVLNPADQIIFEAAKQQLKQQEQK